jgi:type II secretory pathway component GspD/PulD (secretin)
MMNDNLSRFLRVFVSVSVVVFCFLLGACNTIVFAQGVMAADSVEMNENDGAQDDSQDGMIMGSPLMPSMDGGGQGAGQGAASGAPNSSSQVPAVMDIKSVDQSKGTYSLELRDVKILDLFRILSHDYKLNLLVDNSISDLKVTASLSNVSLQEALDSIAELAGLKMEKKGSIIKVSSNIVTEIFVLKYVEVKKILNSVASSSTSSVGATGIPLGTSSSMGMPSATSASSDSSESTPKSESSIFDLLSSQGRILAGAQPNTIIVMDLPPNIEKIRKYIGVVDKRMATRMFRLKYLRASDLVGVTKPIVPTEQTTSSTSSSSSSSSTTTPATTVAGVAAGPI